jgi:hypothetical protein
MPKTTRKRAKPDTSPPATITVQSRILQKPPAPGDESEEVLVDEYEEIDVQVFKTEPAYIEASAGVTKSLRQYESLRVDVKMLLPCYAERADEAFEYAAEWVADRLYQEVDNYFSGEGDDDDS